jgi:uncharacterized membrane protein HdeD (DUF308 family)
VASARTVYDYSRYWVVPITRAAVALAAGVAIALTSNHNSRFGLLVFGAYVLVAGLLVAILSWRTLSDPVARTLLIAQGALGVLAGILALSLYTSGLGLFLYLVSVWAALTGFIELYCGLRARSRGPASRDWLVVGAMTAALALIFLLIPSDAVLAIGLFGAYTVVAGVYLGIGAFSLKWSAEHPNPAEQKTMGSES